MVEIINGVKNLKQLNIGKGLTSSPITNEASGLNSTPVVNKKGGNVKKRKQIAKGLKIRMKKNKILYDNTSSCPQISAV